MKIKTIIALISLGIMTVSCGKDDRIVLSSQDEEYLIIPNGSESGSAISSSKLAQAVASRWDDVSEVYNISLNDRSWWTFRHFNVVFTLRTVSGKVIPNMECLADAYSEIEVLWMKSPVMFYLSHCRNNMAEIPGTLEIPFSELTVSEDGL